MPTRKPPVKKSAPRKTTIQKKTAVKKSKAKKKISKKKTGKKKVKTTRKTILKKGTYNSHYSFNTDLPESYNKTYLRALPKDPTWLFLYWEITKETIDNMINNMGSERFEAAKPVLRLIDITDIEYDGTNEWKYFDINIHYYANNWYVKVPEPGRAYLVKYGSITTDGTFHTIMQSNVVKIPRDNISDIIDEEWATVKTDEMLRFSTSTPLSSVGASDNVVQPPLFQGSSENLLEDNTFRK